MLVLLPVVMGNSSRCRGRIWDTARGRLFRMGEVLVMGRGLVGGEVPAGRGMMGLGGGMRMMGSIGEMRVWKGLVVGEELNRGGFWLLVGRR